MQVRVLQSAVLLFSFIILQKKEKFNFSGIGFFLVFLRFRKKKKVSPQLSPKINHSISFLRGRSFLFFIKKGCVRFMKNGLYEYCEQRRTKLGLSKSEFCAYLGISKPTYWRLSKDEISPNMLEKISNRFAISRERLVKKLCNK